MVGEIHSVHFPTCSNQNVQFVDEGKRPVSPHTIPIRGGQILKSQNLYPYQMSHLARLPVVHGVQTLSRQDQS